MDDNQLYFIAILKKAFEDPDPVQAFSEALLEIVQLAEDSKYSAGFEQFEAMFSLGLKDLTNETEQFSKQSDIMFDRLLARLASATFEGPQETHDILLEYIKANPQLNRRFTRICSELPTIMEELIPIEIDLFRDDSLIITREFRGKAKAIEFPGIGAGNYLLKLSNGRLLWEGYIGLKDVIWKEAFPDQQYPMAADTKGWSTVSTKSFIVGDGNFMLSIEVGLESGKIVLTSLETKNE